MLKEKDNSIELELLKQQIKELRDEVLYLKKIGLNRGKDEQILGNNIGKTIGTILFKQSGSAEYNQQLLKQFYKIATFNVPSSFGAIRDGIKII